MELAEHRPTEFAVADARSKSRTVLDGLAVIGFAVPIALYFWFIDHYGVNAIWYDQWDDIRVAMNPSLGNLWALHNEERIFFPNLIMVALSRLDHLNIVHEEYLGALLLVGASALFILAHKRRAPRTLWLLYCPVTVVMLYFAQVNNTLWGFQIAWFVIMAALAGSLYLLDARRLGWWAVFGAIALGVVASYSSLQGLLIWPTGLVLLWIRRRPRNVLVVWVVAAVASTALYFWNFNTAGGGNDSYPLHHPVVAAEFFFSLIGDVVGESLPYSGHNVAVIVLGVALVALSIWVLVSYGFGQSSTGAALGQALICFGLLFALTVTIGRTSYGLYAAGGSRYTTVDLLVPIGCYLALLERAPRRMWVPRGALMAATACALVLIVALGTGNGLNEARQWNTWMVADARVTLNIDKEPNGAVVAALYPAFHPPIAFVRHEAHVARARHWATYANP
jgi:hypothetical protein